MCAKTIGIIGGMGPKTGIDLANKIIQNTLANKDQDHLPLLLISYPSQIKDRTEFLQGKHSDNPAYIISHLIRQLESWGASVIGIPCNTSHSPQIMTVICRQLIENQSQAILVNMIEAVAEFILSHFSSAKRIGLLATLGTYDNAIYQTVFQQYGLNVIVPDVTTQQSVQQAIYHPQYGIKSTSALNLDTAKSLLEQACHHLVDLGAEAVVLGCSEIPLVLTEKFYQTLPLIDATDILARKLIKLAAPDKLKPYNTVR